MSERPARAAPRAGAQQALSNVQLIAGRSPRPGRGVGIRAGGVPDPGRGDHLSRRERAARPCPSRRHRRRNAPRAKAQLGERTLSEGSEGPDVRTLQSILSARGYGEIETTGRFDSATAGAVRRFQREAGLQTDGVVGPQTRPKLLALMRASARDLVRTRAVRQSHGLRPDAAALDARRGPSHAAVRHSRDLLPPGPLRDRERDRPGPVPVRGRMGPHGGRREGARHGGHVPPAHDSLIHRRVRFRRA